MFTNAANRDAFAGASPKIVRLRRFIAEMKNQQLYRVRQLMHAGPRHTRVATQDGVATATAA